MPYDGLFSFLPLSPKLQPGSDKNVSMPYDGLFSFLLCVSANKVLDAWGVNALWRAFFISTLIYYDKEKYIYVVSMPYDGLFSFLF